jgi:hypothetical protein
MAEIEKICPLTKAMKRTLATATQEPGICSALKETSRGPVELQMFQMQNDVLAKLSERSLYFPQSLKVVLEMKDALEQLHKSLGDTHAFTQSLSQEGLKALNSITAPLQKISQIEIPQLKFPNIPEWKFPELPEIDWDAFTEKQRDGAVALANKGWTVPAWMTLPDIPRLGKSTESEIEDFFLTSYLGVDGEEGELKRTLSTLTASSEMRKWKYLLEEIFECIGNKKHRVCVPSLLTILEGFTIESLHKKKHISRKITRVKSAVEDTKWHRQNDFDGIMWLSVLTFLDHLFANSDFSSSPPTSVNRHWVLHGRAATDWTAADALKLVNAISTLHWLFT